MKIERETIEDGQAVRVTFGHWSWVCIFLMIWLSFWSFGCYAMVSGIISGSIPPKEALFTIPFFLGEIVVAGIILFMIFGRTTFVFTRSGWTRCTGIGPLRFSKKGVFPEKCDIVTDTFVTHGKHGPTTHHRLLAKTADAKPLAIYSSTDPKRIQALCDVAREMAAGRLAPLANGAAPGTGTDDEESELDDRELLAEKPPKGVTVTRDFEGRILVTLRRIGWIKALLVIIVVSSIGAVAWIKRQELPLPVFIFMGFVAVFPLVQLLFELFGKRTISLDHGTGTTFLGIGGLGMRRKFHYGSAYDVRLADSSMRLDNEYMDEIVITRPGEQPTKICASWPNDAKPYLAALLRHPEAAAATMPQDGF